MYEGDTPDAVHQIFLCIIVKRLGLGLGPGLGLGLGPGIGAWDQGLGLGTREWGIGNGK